MCCDLVGSLHLEIYACLVITKKLRSRICGSICLEIVFVVTMETLVGSANSHEEMRPLSGGEEKAQGLKAVSY